jgi:hypothetical protein
MYKQTLTVLLLPCGRSCVVVFFICELSSQDLPTISPLNQIALILPCPLTRRLIDISIIIAITITIATYISIRKDPPYPNLQPAAVAAQAKPYPRSAALIWAAGLRGELLPQ